MDEKEAVLRLKRKDMQGLTTLMEMYQVQAVRTSTLITRDLEASEDVVQAVFIRLYERSHLLDPQRPFKPYLMRSVVNTSIQVANKQQRFVSFPDEAEREAVFMNAGVQTPLEDDPQQAFDATERREQLEAALEQLSPKQRAAVVQRYYLGMTEEEIAGQSDEPRGTSASARPIAVGGGMNENDIRAGLRDIAEHEVPDDINLIPAVQRKLRRERRYNVPPSLTRIAAILILTLLSTVTAFAVVQYQHQRYDPGLDSAATQGLFVEFNRTQRVSDIDVTLQRGYADANRIVLTTEIVYDLYQVERPEGGFNINYRLFDTTTSEEIPPVPLGGGGGGGSSSGTPSIMVNIGRDAAFDGSVITGDPETLDLRLEITFATHPTRRDGTSSGGGGGGEMMQPPADQPTMMPLPSPVPVDQFESFTVTFDNLRLPFVDEYVVPKLDAQTVNDVTMTVEQVTVTPSLTALDFCYTVPGSDKLWTPVAHIDTGDDIINVTPMIGPENVTDGRTCVEMRVPLPYVPGEEQTWTFRVDYLRGSFMETEANAERVRQMLAERGLNTELFQTGTGEIITRYGMGFNRGDSPADTTRIIEDVFSQIGGRIDGPWTFSFSVP